MLRLAFRSFSPPFSLNPSPLYPVIPLAPSPAPSTLDTGRQGCCCMQFNFRVGQQLPARFTIYTKWRCTGWAVGHSLHYHPLRRLSVLSPPAGPSLPPSDQACSSTVFQKEQ